MLTQTLFPANSMMLAQAVVRAYLIADEKGYRNLSWVWPLTRGNDLQDRFPATKGSVRVHSVIFRSCH